jgi:hypothetical protein
MSATREVDRTVSELRAEVAIGIDMTTQTARAARAATELAEKSEASLASIVETAGNASAAVLAISDDTVGQSRMGAGIAQAMREMTQLADQTVQKMTASEEAVKELHVLSDSLKSMIESMGADRRRHTRFTLDSPCAIHVDLSGCGQRSLQVMDVSVEGLRVRGEMPAIENPRENRMAVRILRAGPPLDALLEGLEASVAWQDGGFTGFQLRKRLDQGDLHKVFDKAVKGW